MTAQRTSGLKEHMSGIVPPALPQQHAEVMTMVPAGVQAGVTLAKHISQTSRLRRVKYMVVRCTEGSAVVRGPLTVPTEMAPVDTQGA